MYYNCTRVAYSMHVPVEPIYVPVPRTTDRFLLLGGVRISKQLTGLEYEVREPLTPPITCSS
eukprot:scaffold167647_cov31-Attheya_sp.AAC.1